MKYRKLDANGDYTLGTGADFYIDTPEAVGQAIQTRLALYRGEWFLDTADGTPWKTDVLGKYTRDAYDAAIKNRILGTEGVNAIVSYSSNFDGTTRTLNIEAQVNTVYGDTVITGAV